MEYAQLNETGTEATQITTHGNIKWDHNNYCSAEALVKDAKAEQFRVVPLTVIEQPQFDTITQRCFRDGCEKIGNTWQYKWTIEQLPAAQIAINQAIADKLLYDGIVTATQQRLDQFAQTRGYDNILSATTYANSQNPKFAQEGQYALQQRDATWTKLLEVLAETETGTRPKPGGYEDIEIELPVLVWPV